MSNVENTPVSVQQTDGIKASNTHLSDTANCVYIQQSIQVFFSPPFDELFICQIFTTHACITCSA